MASLQSSFDASQKAYKSRVSSFDEANAKWSANFNKSTSTAPSSNSTFSHLIGAINETESYNDPSSITNKILEAGYRYTFTNGLGDYHQTNDNFFDPNPLDGNWTRTDPQ